MSSPSLVVSGPATPVLLRNLDLPSEVRGRFNEWARECDVIEVDRLASAEERVKLSVHFADQAVVARETREGMEVLIAESQFDEPEQFDAAVEELFLSDRSMSCFLLDVRGLDV